MVHFGHSPPTRTPSRVICSSTYLPKRLLFSFISVFALPNASSSGFACGDDTELMLSLVYWRNQNPIQCASFLHAPDKWRSTPILSGPPAPLQSTRAYIRDLLVDVAVPPLRPYPSHRPLFPSPPPPPCLCRLRRLLVQIRDVVTMQICAVLTRSPLPPPPPPPPPYIFDLLVDVPVPPHPSASVSLLPPHLPLHIPL